MPPKPGKTADNWPLMPPSRILLPDIWPAPASREYSTVVERQRSCVFCLHDSRLLAIQLEDPTTKKRFWSLPGGAIEAGETPAIAAVRETLEETGYQVTLTSDGFPTQYEFHWDGAIYDCTTHWFTAKLSSTEPVAVDDASYLLNSRWLPWPRSQCLFTNNPAFNEAFERFRSI